MLRRATDGSERKALWAMGGSINGGAIRTWRALATGPNAALLLETGTPRGYRQVGVSTLSEGGWKEKSFGYVAPVGEWVHLAFVCEKSCVAASCKRALATGCV